jgi:hypothetical protein
MIADINQGRIQSITCTADYSSCGNPTAFTAGATGGTVKLAQGPDGSIYQLLLGPGTLTRITPTTTVV